MRKLAILGSTGSIGTQALDVAARHSDRFAVTALVAHSSSEKLFEQVRQFHPKIAALSVEPKEIPADIKNSCQWMFGENVLLDVVHACDADDVLVSVVGVVGLAAVMETLACGKRVLLANKEPLVAGGELVTEAAKKAGHPLLPVDSEHSAIFQALHGEDRGGIEKILITASGGPFRGKNRAELENVQVEDALKHPNWSMGQKITIDSATLVNKGLEVMEAKWLFGVDLDRIQVVVQPKSIIHSMVEFKDGAVIAQLGTPDMKLPIQYALYYPERRYLPGDRLDFWKLKEITFEKPDTDTFLGLPLAFQAARTGGSMPTVFNAANERAVSKFLHRKIRFLDIYDIISDAMEHHKVIPNPSIEEILAAEQATYERIESRW